MTVPPAARLLLISNSRSFGGGYLDHCAEAIRSFLKPEVRRVLFVPYAIFDRDAYAASMANRMNELGYTLHSLHAASNPRRAIREAKAVFVGGGNTFRLLWWLERLGVLPLLRRRVKRGMPYIGVSAGVNISCPTIRTTNDMPIVEPRALRALGIVPFQINPHYLDPDPGSRHMGETRETRIKEYLEENESPVIGLREGAWLRIDGGRCRLEGSAGARLFRRGFEPEEIASPGEIDIAGW